MKKEIEAEIWSIKICGSTVDVVHGNYQTIKEIYIKSEGIACNMADGYLHCFESNYDRYGMPTNSKILGTKMLPSIFVEKAKQYIKLQGELLLNIKNYIGDK